MIRPYESRTTISTFKLSNPIIETGWPNEAGFGKIEKGFFESDIVEVEL